MNDMLNAFNPAVSEEIFQLRPDYCAVGVVANGLDNVARHPIVDEYVEESVKSAVRASWAADHLQAWRAAYRAFGENPQRTPNSADALMMRLDKDGRLPNINALVDLYNAFSVRYAVPVGGENIDAYVGHPRLLRATGAESFDTIKNGEPEVKTVPEGEVVWADDRGVTCRRWNWRQGIRTTIDLQTRRAWFVFDRFERMPVDAATDVAFALMNRLQQISPAAQVSANQIDRTGITQIS